MSDRDNPGNSVQPDGARIHNQHHHWLFKKTDELNNATVYRRDERRRVTNIYYYNASNTRVASEVYTYNQCNQVTSDALPSTTVVCYQYNAWNQVEPEYNSVQGFDERTEYSYDGLARVERVRAPSRSRWRFLHDNDGVQRPPSDSQGSLSSYRRQFRPGGYL